MYEAISGGYMTKCLPLRVKCSKASRKCTPASGWDVIESVDPTFFLLKRSATAILIENNLLFENTEL